MVTGYYLFKVTQVDSLLNPGLVISLESSVLLAKLTKVKYETDFENIPKYVLIIFMKVLYDFDL